MEGLSAENYRKIQSLQSAEVLKPVIGIEELEMLAEGNGTLMELLENMLDQCLKYTETIAEFVEIEEKLKKGEVEADDFVNKGADRGRLHDLTVDSINIFSRALAREKKDNSWIRDMVGNRAAYGRFAITLTLSRINGQLA